MKKSLFTKFQKGALLALPAAALMLGAANAQTTVGINFQGTYYGYASYAFGPVTSTAFGVGVADWFTDPSYSASGTMTAGASAQLTVNWSAADVWSSLCEGDPNAANGPWNTPLPGNPQVLWGYLDDGGDSGPGNSVTVSGLASTFPNGYVVQTIAAEEKNPCLFANSSVSDGVTTDDLTYSNYWNLYNWNGPVNGANGVTAGLSAQSDTYTSDSITISGNGSAINTGASPPVRGPLCGFIITDQPVVSQDPASGTYPFGQPIELSVGAIGIQALSYQWRSNGIPIAGATAASYTNSNALAGSYNYDVIVTNLYGSATSAVATVTVTVPGTLTWDATETAGAADGSGTWDDGVTANWWNGSNNVVWSDLDSAVFGAGGTNAYTVTVASSLEVGSLTFNSGNYTIAGVGITLTGTTPQIVANTNAIISAPLAGNNGLTMSGSGTVIFTNGNTFDGNLLVTGGTLLTGEAGGATYLGAVNGTRTITVDSGATIAVANNNVFNGGGQTAASIPSVVINGGTFTSTRRYNSIGNVVLNSGGTLSQASFDTGTYQGYDFLGSITAGGSSASTISTSTGRGDHLLGGSTNLFNVADVTGDANPDLIVSAPLIDGSGDYPGIGSLLKSGAGTLELSGVNTYTGTTTVSNGTLLVTGQLTGNGNITLEDATALNVTAAGTTQIIPSSGSLTLGGSGTSTNALGFDSLNSTTVAPISVGAVSLVNPVTINITGTIVLTGSYPLVQYGIESGSGTFILGALPNGVSATLVDNNSSSVSLNVTATPMQTEVWNGNLNGAWDISNTANWLVNAVSSVWVEENIATFDDTASGTTAVTLNAVVHPAILTFNNSSKNYTISGSGAIAGAIALTLNGSGMVTLDNTNTYSGGTVLNAGILSISSDTNFGTGPLTLNGGTLDITGTTAFSSGKNVALDSFTGAIQVDNTAGASFTPAITGVGMLTKTGNGTLTFSVQQTYTGGTTINGGILDLTGGGGSSGTIFGTVTVNAGGTLQMDTGDAFGYAGGANAINTLNLAGGTLNVNTLANQTLGSAVIYMTGGAITGLTGANIDFFGGSSALYTYASSTPSTISGLQLSPLRQASTIFDIQAGTTPNGIDLDISSVMKDSGFIGAVLYKTDAGTMRLSAVNTYQGNTELQGGTLILTGRLIGGGAMAVDDYYPITTLDVSSGAGPAIFSPTNNLTLGAFSTGSIMLGFANIYSPTVPLISVSNLVVNGTVTVNISGSVAVGQFPLIKYGGTDTGAGSLTLGTLPANVSASLSNNVANQSVDLVVSSAPLSIIEDISSGTNYAYAGTTYALSVAAGGNPTIGYQWFQNNAPINAATAPTLTLTRLTANDVGSYYAIATNADGSVSSSTNYLVVLPDSGYTALVVGTGPIAFWPLNETNGTTALDIWGGNDATYSGTYTLDYATNPYTGTPGAHFDGASGKALTPYVAALNPLVFTAEAWVKPDSVPGSEYCVLSCGQFGSPRSGWLIYQFPGYWDFRTYYGNGTSVAAEVTNSTAPVLGSWTHLAVTWDGTTAQLYVNGTLQGSTVSTNTPAYLPGASGGFCAGARADSGFFFPGTVADAALYDRVLTPEEIKTHVQNAPDLQITPSHGNVVLSWVPSGGGNLLAAPAVTGAYTNVPGATSPWTNAPDGGSQFYRLMY